MPTLRPRATAAALVFLSAAMAGAATVVLQQDNLPSASYTGTVDAFVASSLPSNNYGSAGALAVSAPGSAKGEFQSFLQFDLAAAKSFFDSPAQFNGGNWVVTAVQLQLTATPPGNSIFNSSAAGNFGINWVANDSWVEGTGIPSAPDTSTANRITFSNVPTNNLNDQSLGTSFSFNGSTSGLFTYNLTPSSGLLNDIATGDKASFQLLAQSGSVSALFDSRNFSNTGSPGFRPALSITAVAAPEPGRIMLLGVACMMLLMQRTRR